MGATRSAAPVQALADTALQPSWVDLRSFPSFTGQLLCTPPPPPPPPPWQQEMPCGCCAWQLSQNSQPRRALSLAAREQGAPTFPLLPGLKAHSSLT